MARLSPLLGLVALGLVAAVGAPGPASASDLPNHRPLVRQTPAQLNLAPTRQRAVSTAVGVGGDAFASASNQTLGLQDNGTLAGRRGATPQLNRSPTVQTAVSAAISVGGNSAALASNTGGGLSGNLQSGNGPVGGVRPVSPLQLGRSPATSTAVSTAVSIDGVAIPASR
jgi:hypothetical protein